MHMVRRCSLALAWGLALAAATVAPASVLSLYTFNDVPPGGTTTSAAVNHQATPPLVYQGGLDAVPGGGPGNAFTDADGVARAAGRSLCFVNGVADLGDQVLFTFNPSADRNLVLSYDYTSSPNVGAPGAMLMYRLTGTGSVFSVLGTDSYTQDDGFHRVSWNLSSLIPGIGASRQVQLLITPQAGSGGGSVAYDNLQLAGTPAMRGDTNGDGAVNFTDLLSLAQHYGTPGTVADGDLNWDGRVNFNDLLMLAQSYGTHATAAVAADVTPVPESGWPMFAGMLGCVGLFPHRPRRR
jgi:hypothetical protein